jgi:hypothetical protein
LLARLATYPSHCLTALKAPIDSAALQALFAYFMTVPLHPAQSRASYEIAFRDDHDTMWTGGPRTTTNLGL